MDRWVVDAILAMLFAGVTAVIAKQGLEGISSELGLVVRTLFVLVFVISIWFLRVPVRDVKSITWSHVSWLGFSAVTTALSWHFYYRAIQDGKVSTVAVIDKGSFIVAVLLAWMILGEHVSVQTMIGTTLIFAGLVIVVLQ
ncbi:EamA family transporter [Thalassoglobus sp. JC818]|uniref:EamA family transporter n=1 Tax=Thalassoglobus sp. JC818 TaxID=3232136 RepID=UPI00345A0148